MLFFTFRNVVVFKQRRNLLRNEAGNMFARSALQPDYLVHNSHKNTADANELTVKDLFWFDNNAYLKKNSSSWKPLSTLSEIHAHDGKDRDGVKVMTERQMWTWNVWTLCWNRIEASELVCSSLHFCYRSTLWLSVWLQAPRGQLKRQSERYT